MHPNDLILLEKLAVLSRSESYGSPSPEPHRFDEAISWYQKWIAADPLNQEAYYALGDRKSTRLNSSHEWISYAVFCLKEKNRDLTATTRGGAGRFTYPATSDANMIINASGSGMADRYASVDIDPVHNEVSASAASGHC